jgi:ElaB/YqjD/DUF883 family membrane-anchored ribosome-binding protein
MSGSSRYSRAVATEVGEIERHLRSLEKNLEKLGARASANAKGRAESLGDFAASALTGWADRFRQSASSLGGQSAALSKDAAKLGTAALDRLSREATPPHLVTLAVALGVGILIGLAVRSWD